MYPQKIFHFHRKLPVIKRRGAHKLMPDPEKTAGADEEGKQASHSQRPEHEMPSLRCDAQMF
jgi:hypothetical protein